jgi:hypothetical protein
VSSTTWTHIELASEAKPFAASVWRSIPTNTDRPLTKLVNSASDAKLIAEMLSEVSPRSNPGEAEYDDVIAKPFSYGRKGKHGSRFRAVSDDGVLYCALDIETALREQAWWRVQFVLASHGLENPKGLPLQVFKIFVEGKHLDLTSTPLNAYSELWTHKEDYSNTQELARAARTSGIEAIKYSSVRNAPNGVCLVVLALPAIKTKTPDFLDENWWLSIQGSLATLLQDPLVGTGDSYSFDFSF